MTSKFDNKTTWLFDLDNTLYSPDLGIFKQIDVKMKRFISKELKVSEKQAFQIQKKFYKNYGTTLYGLMKYHNTDPEEFLKFVHNIDFTNLKKCEDLRKKIKNLPGKKFIYTNGNYEYAKKILNSLGITNVFSDIFDIRKANFFPKPMKTSLNKLIKNYNLVPKEIVYFDDLDKNLKSAFLKGITTIHISKDNSKKSSYIDFRFRTIINALDMIRNKLEH